MSDETLSMWENVKQSLHISHNKLDEEIKSKVESCKLDMKRVGISTDSEDELIYILCELYVKWHLNFNGMGETFRMNYEQMRDAVSLADQYRMKEGSCTGATGGEANETSE